MRWWPPKRTRAMRAALPVLTLVVFMAACTLVDSLDDIRAGDAAATDGSSPAVEADATEASAVEADAPNDAPVADSALDAGGDGAVPACLASSACSGSTCCIGGELRLDAGALFLASTASSCKSSCSISEVVACEQHGQCPSNWTCETATILGTDASTGVCSQCRPLQSPCTSGLQCCPGLVCAGVSGCGVVVDAGGAG